MLYKNSLETLKKTLTSSLWSKKSYNERSTCDNLPVRFLKIAIRIVCNIKAGFLSWNENLVNNIQDITYLSNKEMSEGLKSFGRPDA